MKTAISVPDDIFEASERAARRLGISRSEFYARAAAAYLDQLRRSDVTARLDEVHSEETSALDPVISELQARSLRRSR
jgi:metal-responsive CopG/Arc/MetJ family transcriptional regulator